MQTSAVVVVGAGTPEVRSELVTIFQDVAACHVVNSEVAVGAREFDVEIGALDDEVVPVVFDEFRSFATCNEFNRLRLVGLHGVLLTGNHLTGADELGSVFLHKLDVEQHFLALAHLVEVVRQSEFSLGLRSHLEVVDDARLNCFAASHQCPLHAIVREVDEEVFVVYRNLASLQVDRSRPDVLVDVAHLVHVRVRHAVGANQTVVVEVAVRTVVRVVVAAVFVDFNAILAFSA